MAELIHLIQAHPIQLTIGLVCVILALVVMVVFRRKKRCEVAQYTLENRSGESACTSEQEILEQLEKLFSDPEEFLLLTAAAAQNGVKSVRGCLRDGEITVELETESDDGAGLLCKTSTRTECQQIFTEFYRGTFEPDRDEYRPEVH